MTFMGYDVSLRSLWCVFKIPFIRTDILLMYFQDFPALDIKKQIGNTHIEVYKSNLVQLKVLYTSTFSLLW